MQVPNAVYTGFTETPFLRNSIKATRINPVKPKLPPPELSLTGVGSGVGAGAGVTGTAVDALMVTVKAWDTVSNPSVNARRDHTLGY